MRTALALLTLLAPAACRESVGRADAEMPPAGPARPEACRVVQADEPLQRVLDDSAIPVICLGPGLHPGPFKIARAVTVWGPREAVLRAPTGGSIVNVTGQGATLLGFTIDGTGGSFDRTDAGVYLSFARGARVEGVHITNAVFGLVVEQSERVQLVRNVIDGSRDPSIGLRGDTMRLWELKDSTIADNVVHDGRDILIWYSRNNQIIDNRIEGGRYGFHFMYSHDSEVAHNQVLRAVVGVFAMYSRNIAIRDNVIGGATGSAGMGVGLKESGNIDVAGNRMIRNSSAIYIDNSPLQLSDHLLIERNELRLNDRAIVFHSSGHRVTITDNDFLDNGGQAQVDGGGDATDVIWRGNHFDDYAGYDLDGDDRGDVAYELRSLSNQLTSSNPNLALFRGTLALGLVDAAAHLDPLYQPQAVLTDPAPRMSASWRPTPRTTP